MAKIETKTTLRERLKVALSALDEAEKAFEEVKVRAEEARKTYLILLSVLAEIGPPGVSVSRHTAIGIGTHLPHLGFEVVAPEGGSEDQFLVRLLYDGAPPEGSPIVTIN